MNNKKNIKISGKYQIVIPKEARKKFNLKAGDQLITRIDDEKIIFYPKPNNFTKYAKGLGKEIWQGIDTASYIQGERESWKD